MIYNAGGKSSEVIIDLENNTVIKKFKEEQKKKFVRGLGYHCYLRELECLKRLKGHKNFPQLIDYDDEELTITMDYCGTHFPTDGQSRPELLQQVYDIVNTLEEKNIKFTTTQFPYQNILIKDNIIKMIDFELALPDGSDNLKYFKNHLIETIREKYDIQKFENEFKILVVKGVVIDDHKYERTLIEANDMVKNEWNNYQKSNVGNSAKWRINKLDLTQYGGSEKTLLDLGANHGEFCVELANNFKTTTGVEPFVEPPKEMPSNMRWIKKGFKDFISTNNEEFDVVFSFAMTIQVRNVDGLNETQIADGHYNLIKSGGIMIYETQKLEGREMNQRHVDLMLPAFREKFGTEIKSGSARESGKRQYYVFKK